MAITVSKCLRQERVRQTGQLGPCETPRSSSYPVAHQLSYGTAGLGRFSNALRVVVVVSDLIGIVKIRRWSTKALPWT